MLFLPSIQFLKHNTIQIKKNIKKDVENGENNTAVITELAPTAALNTKTTEIKKRILGTCGLVKKLIVTHNEEIIVVK